MNDFSPEVILSSNLSRNEDVLDNEAGNDNDPRNSSVLQSEMKNPTVSGSTPAGEQHHQEDERLLVVPLPKTADSSSTTTSFAHNITEDAAGIELTANLDDQAGKPHEDCSKGGYLPAPQPPTATIDRFRRRQQEQQEQQKYHYGGAGIISDPSPSQYCINNHLLHHGHHGDHVTNEIITIINDEASYGGAPQQAKEQSGVLPPNQPHAGLILIQPPVLQQQQGTGNFFLVTGQGNGTEGTDLNLKSSTIGAHRTSYTNNHVLRGGGSSLPQSQNLHRTEQLHLHNPSVVAQLLAAERNRFETIQMGMRINQQQDVFQAQHYLSQPPRLHHVHRPRVLLEQGNTVDAGTQYSNFISERRAGFIPDRDIIQPSDIIIGKNAATEGNVTAYINEPHLQDRAGSANILKINGVESASAFAHGHPVDISSSRLPNSRTLLPTGNNVSDDAFPLQINSIPHHQYTTASSTLLNRGSQYYLNNDERECQEERKFHPHFSASQFTTNGVNEPLQKSFSDKKEQPKKKKKQQKKRKLGAQKKSEFAEKRPRRPLTAYNFFFSEERERVLVGLPTINNSTTGESHEFESSNAKELHAQGVGATTAKETVNGAMELSAQGEGINIDKADITSLQYDHLNDADLKELEAKISANTQRILKTHKHMEKPKKAHRKIHGKINFQSLAKTIGGRWRALSDERKQYYKDLASKDKLRYCEGMKKFNKIENRINYND